MYDIVTAFVYNIQVIRIDTSLLGVLGLACLAFLALFVAAGEGRITIFYFSNPHTDGKCIYDQICSLPLRSGLIVLHLFT